MTSDHFTRVKTLTRMLIREAARRARVSVGPGVKIHQAGRGGAVISRA